MIEEIDYKKVMDDVSLIIEKLPTAQQAYGIGVNSYLPILNYPQNQEGLKKLDADFKEIDFSLIMHQNDLKREIKQLQDKKRRLEESYTALSSLIGEDGTAGEGTVFHDLVTNLRNEVNELIKRRDELDTQVSEKERELSIKIESINEEVITAGVQAKEKIVNAEENARVLVETATNKANQKVKLIEQFSVFLSETNDNMKLYHWVTIILTIGFMITVIACVPGLLKCFDSYDSYVNGLYGIKTPWQILNYAFGILIVKLPWALVISAVFTGFYRLIKGLLITYEKINQDKRNMSAIYAVTGNVAQGLNDYGFAIIDANVDLENDNREIITLEVSRSQLSQKRESLKWNQIMNYFQKMETHKVEPDKDEDAKLKIVSDLLNKVIDKLPTGK